MKYLYIQMSSWANVAKNSGSSSKHHNTSNAAPFKIRRETSTQVKDEVAVEVLASIPKIDPVPTGKSPKLKGKQYVSLKNKVTGKSPAREKKKKGNLFAVLSGGISSSSEDDEDEGRQDDEGNIDEMAALTLPPVIHMSLSSRSDMSNVDPDEIQQDEILLISSMYTDEFEPLTKEGVKPIRFRVTLVPLDDNSKNYVQASIDVVLPQNYPMRVPNISVRNVKGLTDSSVAKLTRTLHEEACARLGGDPIMSELLEIANNFLIDLNVPQLSLIEKKQIREKERKEKLQREKEERDRAERERREQEQRELQKRIELERRQIDDGITKSPTITLPKVSVLAEDTPDGYDNSQISTRDVDENENASSKEQEVSNGETVPRTRFDKDFISVRHLGKGGFAVWVKEAKNRLDNKSYAVKKVQLKRNPRMNKKIIREVTTLARLFHNHIVRYYNAWYEDEMEEDAVKRGSVNMTSITPPLGNTTTTTKDDTLSSVRLFF